MGAAFRVSWRAYRQATTPLPLLGLSVAAAQAGLVRWRSRYEKGWLEAIRDGGGDRRGGATDHLEMPSTSRTRTSRAQCGGRARLHGQRWGSSRCRIGPPGPRPRRRMRSVRTHRPTTANPRASTPMAPRQQCATAVHGSPMRSTTTTPAPLDYGRPVPPSGKQIRWTDLGGSGHALDVGGGVGGLAPKTCSRTARPALVSKTRLIAPVSHNRLVFRDGI